MNKPPVNSMSLEFLTEMSICLDKLETERKADGLILTSVSFDDQFSFHWTHHVTYIRHICLVFGVGVSINMVLVGQNARIAFTLHYITFHWTMFVVNLKSRYAFACG